MDHAVIWGAGAIGGTIGAALARAGADPLLVDADAAHVAALNAGGLKITGPIEEYTVPVRAVTPDQVKGPLSRILLAVKGQHSGAAARMIAPLLASDGSVLSLQNGLNAEAIAAEVGAERTLLASDFPGAGVERDFDLSFAPLTTHAIELRTHFEDGGDLGLAHVDVLETGQWPPAPPPSGCSVGTGSPASAVGPVVGLLTVALATRRTRRHSS